jgi:chorismate synthase
LPVGLGEPIFSSLESDLAKAIYSIPAVKGVEFGSGFAGSETFGSENNDSYIIKNGKIVTKTNNAGGILGGLSNGMPIIIRVAFKPASSIAKKQKTVDIKTKKPTTLIVEGRHDPCVVPRAPPVVDSLVSLVIAEHALQGGFIKPVI